MPRPHKCRNVAGKPQVTVFKPAGVPAEGLQTVELGLDELEALRLADVEGLYQDAAAERMGISRATFGRLIQTARQKVATAIVEGRMLAVEGGKVAISPVDKRVFICGDCSAHFELPFGTGRPADCPNCSSPRVSREDGEACHGRRRRQGCGGRWGHGGAHGGHQQGTGRSCRQTDAGQEEDRNANRRGRSGGRQQSPPPDTGT